MVMFQANEEVDRIGTLVNDREDALIAANLFEMRESGEQVVVIVAHHLVVDVVSWNIILQDLEQLLQGGASLHKSLSFQTWTTMQREKALASTLEQVFPHIDTPVNDLASLSA